MNEMDWDDLLIKHEQWKAHQLAQMTPEERALMARGPVETVDADVVAAAMELIENEGNARRWLGSPSYYFRGRTLAEVAGESEDGRQQVIGYIMGVVHGNYM